MSLLSVSIQRDGRRQHRAAYDKIALPCDLVRRVRLGFRARPEADAGDSEAPLDGNAVRGESPLVRQRAVAERFLAFRSHALIAVQRRMRIDQALYMNNKTTDLSINRDCNLLDYCRLKDITIQAWSPLQIGMFGGTFIDNPDYPELNKVLGELADREGVSKTAIAIAWILRHPAKMQAIIGTMNPEHIKDACQATDVNLSHHDWYELYLAAGKFLP